MQWVKYKTILGIMSNVLPKLGTFLLSKILSYPEVQLSLSKILIPPNVDGNDFKIISKFVLVISILLTSVVKSILLVKTYSKVTYVPVSMGSGFPKYNQDKCSCLTAEGLMNSTSE